MLLLLYVCLVTSALFCSSPDLLTHPVAAGSEAENVFNGNLGFELNHCLHSPASLLWKCPHCNLSGGFRHCFFLCASIRSCRAHVASLSGMG